MGRRPRSPWRDFKFVLNQVARTIEPPLPLTRPACRAGAVGVAVSRAPSNRRSRWRACSVNWRTISGALAEPPRRRQPQLSAYFGSTELPEDHAARTSWRLRRGCRSVAVDELSADTADGHVRAMTEHLSCRPRQSESPSTNAVSRPAQPQFRLDGASASGADPAKSETPNKSRVC